MSKKIAEKDAQTGKMPEPKTGIFLRFGYQDKENPELFHKHVGFGKRPTGADFIRAAEDGGGSDLQFALGLAQAAITEFGGLQMPCPMTVLLSLNQIDRERLLNAYYNYLVDTRVGEGAMLEDGRVRLGKVLERADRQITEVVFGKLLTGYDEIEIESAATSFWQGNVLRMTKEITEPNDLTVAEIESLDVDDFTLLRNAEEQWLNSFRQDGEEVA